MSIKKVQPKKMTLLVLMLLAVVLLAGITAAWSRTASKPLTTITVGMEATAVNTLIYLAGEQGYFKANHLRVILKDDYPSGSVAADALLAGEIDVATAAELALVRHAFAEHEILAFGNIDRFMHQYLIGRQDRGIKTTADLKGKRIGVPFKTGAQFNLSRFLMLNNIKENEVRLIDVQAPQSADAMLGKKVDAVVTWQPFAMNIRNALTDGASTVWSIQNGQPTYCTLITSAAFLTEKQEALERFLQSLLAAEDYLQKQNERAKAIIQKLLNYSDEYIQAVWAEHEFSVSLDQPFVLALEDQARWMINGKLTTAKSVPGFRSCIDESMLLKLKPYAINIIR